jgi:large subunit ribosomal protein L31e
MEKDNQTKIEEVKQEVNTTEVKTPEVKQEKAIEKKTTAKETKKDSKKENKPVLEREYVVPLRRKTQKVPRYKRAKKAIKVLKEFIAKHMRVEERDLRLVKVDRYLNEEIWFRGIKKPPAKIKVKAIKNSDGSVNIELAEVPKFVQYKKDKQERLQKPAKHLTKSKKQETKVSQKAEEKRTEEGKQDKQEEKQKEESSVEAGLKIQKQEEIKSEHTTKIKSPKQTQIHRKAMKR